MLKRPTSRGRNHAKPIELNLVPILDTMVTLIGFLLFTTSFLSIVSIESPFPMASSKEVQQQLKEKPLQLTLTLRDNEAEIWSPFNKIESKKIPNLGPGQPDAIKIHEALLDVKKKFPEETKLVLVPSSDMSYDNLISVMDSVRTIQNTDPPLFHKDAATGSEQEIQLLFPDVIFGNLLETGRSS